MRSSAQSTRLRVPVFQPLHTPHVDWGGVARPIRAALLAAGIATILGAAGLVIESSSDAYARAVVRSYSHVTAGLPR